jgi:GNAT superfamily N-acetyltransferase
MEVRSLAVSELPRLAECAREFYQSSRFLRHFDMARFEQLWTGLLATGTGTIFALVDDGRIVGTLGGVMYPETYSDELIAQEFFWFCQSEHRGQGLKLYRAFEQWARKGGCSQVRMAHLSDSMPEKLKRVYARLGFEEVETSYAKRLR